MFSEEDVPRDIEGWVHCTPEDVFCHGFLRFRYTDGLEEFPSGLTVTFSVVDSVVTSFRISLGGLGISKHFTAGHSMSPEPVKYIPWILKERMPIKMEIIKAFQEGIDIQGAERQLGLVDGWRCRVCGLARERGRFPVYESQLYSAFDHIAEKHPHAAVPKTKSAMKS